MNVATLVTFSRGQDPEGSAWQTKDKAMPDGQTVEVRSVLIYSMGEISGDGLIKLPFIAALKQVFPTARITWCAAKGDTVYATWLKPVIAGLIDEVINTGSVGLTLTELLLFKRPFGGRRFDVLIDTQSNIRRSLVVRRAARLFISPSANFALSDRRPKAWPEPLVERLETLLSLAANHAVASKPLSLTNPRALEAAFALLPRGPLYVGLAPGAGGLERRWPIDRYITVAHRQEALGRQPVFILGPAEADYVDLLKHACPTALFPEPDRTDPFADVQGPLLTIALATRLSAAVASDAGPGHMMAAGGAPLVSLARSRRKALKFRPAVDPLQILVAEDYGGEAIDLIPLEAVLDRIEAVISSR